MFIDSIYEADNSRCLINTDFIVDIFRKKDKWIAYTFDNEREGYILQDNDVKALRKGEHT